MRGRLGQERGKSAKTLTEHKGENKQLKRRNKVLRDFLRSIIVWAGGESSGSYGDSAAQEINQYEVAGISIRNPVEPRWFHVDRPNSKWVIDISYIHTKQGMFRLAMIQNLYNNSIVAYIRIQPWSKTPCLLSRSYSGEFFFVVGCSTSTASFLWLEFGAAALLHRVPLYRGGQSPRCPGNRADTLPHFRTSRRKSSGKLYQTHTAEAFPRTRPDRLAAR